MSVIRIAEAIQPSEWLRSADTAYLQLREKTPCFGNSLRIVVAALLITLNPIALAAFAMAAWRLGQDLDWTGNFFIEGGLFSHWQIWFAIALALKVTHIMLARFDAARSLEATPERPAASEERPVRRAA